MPTRESRLDRLRQISDPLRVLEALFAHSPDAFALFLPDGHCHLVNPAFRALFGSIPPPEYVIFEDTLALSLGILPDIRRAFAGEEVKIPHFWYDARQLENVRVSEGNRVAIELSLVPCFDDNGVLQCVAVTYKDVTATLELAAERDRLRDTEERLLLALSAARMVAWEASRDSGPISYLGDVKAVLGVENGYAPTYAEAMALVHPDDRERVIANVQKAGLNPSAFLIRVVRPDNGEVVWLDRRSEYVPKRNIWRGVLIDITARHSAEEQLRRSERRFRKLVGHGTDIVSILDRNGKVIWTSPSIERVLGWTVEERQQHHASEWLHPDEIGVAWARLKEILDNPGQSFFFEYRTRHKNGEWRWMEGLFTNLLEDSDINGLVLFQHDITDRRRAESLRERAAELELANRRAEESTRLKSEFLANMSHELRTPLNAIVGFAELLHDGRVVPETTQREFLGDILASGRHLLQLINDILDLAKVESGKLVFRPEVVEIAQVVDEVVAILRTSAAERRVTVVAMCAPELLTVELDPSRCKQVLYNYLSNAIKFTPEGGRVVVRVTVETNDSFRIAVEDTGPGIAPADIGRLFLEFQQLDGGSARQHPGTGLGLALTRRLVEAQGGKVGVHSTVGEGSVFFAVLPRKAGRSSGPRKAPPISAKPRILVVEDERRDQEVISEILTSAGYDVEIVETGARALERCQETHFDAITLDLLLPDMNGLELLAALRTGGHAAETPVIVVTVIADRRAASGVAVQEVLHKPIEPRALLDAVGRAIPAEADVLIVDDDQTARRLLVAALAELGHRAIGCETGAEALTLLAARKPLAMIVDLLMPEMDGFELIDRVRAQPEGARLPLLVWTGKDLTPEEEQRLTQSAHATLAKKSGSDALLHELRNFLHSS